MINNIKKYWSSGDVRSVKAKRNIILSFGNKAIAIIISFAIVPITIDYLNPEQYGIWLTLCSIVTWISFFDIGFGHGFRNKFAEAQAKGDVILAKKYVSTTYFAMFAIFSCVLLTFEFANQFINWPYVLNISPTHQQLLSLVFSIILIGICTQFVANVFTTMLTADQQPAASSIISTIGQACALLAIYILTKQPHHSMVFIAVALIWIPVIITILVSVWMFTHQYKTYSPSFKFIDKRLIRNIVSLGVKFFVIQVSMILIFQVINVILSRELGPTAVTEYNVVYKYFSIPLMAFNIITAPFWSAYTDAYTKGDYEWMKRVLRKLTKVYVALLFVSVVMLLISPYAIDLWLNGSVPASFSVSASVMFYVCALSYGQMFMVLLNGIGKIYIQMLTYIFFAIICIPTTVLLCRNFGITGIMLFYAVIYLSQAILAKMQLKKILNKKAVGIWTK